MYGTLELKSIGNGMVEVVDGFDEYDFDKKGTPDKVGRDFLTKLGRITAGPGQSFPIRFYGTGFLGE